MNREYEAFKSELSRVCADKIYSLATTQALEQVQERLSALMASCKSGLIPRKKLMEELEIMAQSAEYHRERQQGLQDRADVITAEMKKIEQGQQ